MFVTWSHRKGKQRRFFFIRRSLCLLINNFLFLFLEIRLTVSPKVIYFVWIQSFWFILVVSSWDLFFNFSLLIGIFLASLNFGHISRGALYFLMISFLKQISYQTLLLINEGWKTCFFYYIHFLCRFFNFSFNLIL